MGSIPTDSTAHESDGKDTGTNVAPTNIVTSVNQESAAAAADGTTPASNETPSTYAGMARGGRETRQHTGSGNPLRPGMRSAPAAHCVVQRNLHQIRFLVLLKKVNLRNGLQYVNVCVKGLK